MVDFGYPWLPFTVSSCHWQPMIANHCTWLSLAGGGCPCLLITTLCCWLLPMNADGCKWLPIAKPVYPWLPWLPMTANGCPDSWWFYYITDDCPLLWVAALDGWWLPITTLASRLLGVADRYPFLLVAALDCRWLPMTAPGWKWQPLTANGCHLLWMDALSCKTKKLCMHIFWSC
jgi:hypothetical protein